MLMMDSKKENLNRRTSNKVSVSNDDEGSSTTQYTSTTRGIPSLVLDEDTTRKSAESKQKLIDWYESRNTVDPSDVDRCMVLTYSYQRYQVNQGMPVREVLATWPFLGVTKYLLLHCKYLTGTDLESVLRSNMNMKCDSEKPQWPTYFLLLIMDYFREDSSYVVQFFPDLLDITHLNSVSLPEKLCIVGLGEGVTSCNNYRVFVCWNVLPDRVSDFIAAVAVMFASYYVFNVTYSLKALATLEYIQCDLLNLSKPPVATKGQKGGPIRSRRVLSLCKKFAAFVPTQQKRKEQRRAPKPLSYLVKHFVL